jgi:hypothetical protein
MGWTKQANSGGGGGDYELVPAGNHMSIVCGLFDVGTHTESFKGEGPKDTEKIAVVMQLAKRGADGKNYVVADKFTFSLNEKAKFRKFVEGVLGRPLGDDEDFDPRQLVGRPVLTNVVHEPRGEKTYHRLAGVSPLPDGITAPDPATTYSFPCVIWGVGDGEPFPAEHEPWLPWIYGQTIRSMAENCHEVRGRQRQAAPPPAANGGYAPPGVTSAPGPSPYQANAAREFNEFASKPPWG